MNIIVDTTHELMSHSTATQIVQATLRKPDLSILVATGNTPIETYRQLAAIVTEQKIDLSAVTAIQLDEYVADGRPGSPSVYEWMDREFLKPLGISQERTIRFDLTEPDPDRTVATFDRKVDEVGGVDLAILGLGPNGHLGFNEPPSAVDSPTRLVELKPESLISNRVYWGEANSVPTHAYTAGMTTILSAKLVLLVVSGSHKRDILHQTVRGPISEMVPASLLQTISDKVTILADDAAWGDADKP